MNKGTKIALCASAALIAAGVIMTGVGALAGGYEQLDEVNVRFENSMDRDWRLPWGLSGTYNGGKKEAGQEVFRGDFETDIDDVANLHSLDVEIGIHSVEINEGDESGIRIRGTDCDRVQAYVKDGTLYVKDVGNKKIPKNNSLNGKNRHIVVTVPSGTEWKEAELIADMGSVTMDVLYCDEADMDADMGSIEVDTAVIGELEVDGSMGNIEIHDAQIGRLEMEASMGNIEISGVVEGDVKAEAEMGNISLTLGQKEEDFNYRISADMGNVTIDGRDYNGLDEEKEIRNDADKKMELNSSMGNIDILFK